MLILFEDAETTPTSKLLRNSMQGNNILFAGSNANLEDKIRANLGTPMLVFVDYPLNNRYAQGCADYLATEFSEHPEIIIIRIPCLEYFVLKMLYQYGYVKLTSKISDIYLPYTDIDAFLHSSTTVISGQKAYMKKPFLEKMYKKALGDLCNRSYCLRNARVDANVSTSNAAKLSYRMRGLFYTNDCPCNFNCQLGITDASLSLKANRLLFTLPVIPKPRVIPNDIVIKAAESITVEEVKRKKDDYFAHAALLLGIKYIRE